ncbi:MAG: hypothetical protein IPM57_07860 [Oligoflexia bacterium]|nr:hypothetical protein [Oligoflexia bacterium]
MRYLLTLALILLFPKTSYAVISIPSSLSAGEQELVLQTLGFGTSFRPVNNPYPLGGYSGFEMGLSANNIPTQDIGLYGGGSSVEKNVTYPLISIGKGIFDNIDILFNFIPYGESTGIGIYAGALRWSFFQATFVPASFGLLLHGSSTNVNNVFNSQTVGADIITGVNIEPFSFYLGAGSIHGQGQFNSTLTTTGFSENQVVRAFHTLIGLNVEIASFFTAFEIDVYNTTIIALKFGARL